jgi:nucleoside 2-deoxyribosyltransferase
MLHIAGGAYLEYCVEPHWSQLFGSGVRAAASLSKLSKKIILHTYISKQHDRTLKMIADAFRFEVIVKKIPKTISFSYTHGLSEPQVRPQISSIKHATAHQVIANNILCFGFMEGDAVVHGKKVVFDPQSFHDPKQFGSNGSTAERLAIVANLREASKMTGENVLHRIGRKLIAEHKAEIALIKRGPLGASLFSKAGSMVQIAPYKSEFVWAIGSGDVYASSFAHYWAERGFTAFRAAKLASMAAAVFCNSRSLPLPSNFMKTTSLETIDFSRRRTKKVYLAAPFFTMSQRWLVEEVRNCLHSFGVPVFSPYHDVGLGAASNVVPLDIKALNRSDLVLVLADGLDTGTIFEAGHARAKGIPVIAFVQNEKEGDLKMLQGTHCEIVRDFVSAMYRTAWLALER